MSKNVSQEKEEKSIKEKVFDFAMMFFFCDIATDKGSRKKKL